MGIEETAEALARIEIARSLKSEELNLSSLAITTEDLEMLIPLIAETSVTKLYLMGNPFQDLPETINQLQNLIHLIIKANEFMTLPESIGELTELRKLRVRGNHLTTLPESIGNLENLSFLDVSGDRFTALPESIGNLANLTKLHVVGNSLTTLPQSIGKLKNLEELYASGNRFATLPESVGDLTNLKLLNLTNSAIREVPETLSNLQNIQSILLLYCPLSDQTMIWLDHTFRLEVIAYNMAAHEQNQTAEEILQLVYTDPNEQASIITNIKNSDLDSGTIIYGESHAEIKPAKEIIKEFLGNIQIHDQYNLNYYSTAIKYVLDRMLNKEHFSKEKRANMLLTISTALGDCSTPLKDLLEKITIKLLLKQKTSSFENQTILERAALKEATNKLGGYRRNERIEQLHGLLNSIYLIGAEKKEHNSNLHIMGERIRLPSISSYTNFCFQQINNNPTLIRNFVCMVCQTTADNQPIVHNNMYLLDNHKIKKIKDQYIAEHGFGTEQQKEIKKYLKIYSHEMTEFQKKHTELFTDFFKEAKHLLDISSHTEELKELLSNGDIKELYEKFLSQKKSEIATFLKEKKNPKPQLDGFRVAINEKENPHPKSPNQSDVKQANETRLTPRR